jgi:hypothetical protein
MEAQAKSQASAGDSRIDELMGDRQQVVSGQQDLAPGGPRNARATGLGPLVGDHAYLFQRGCRLETLFSNLHRTRLTPP